LVVHRRWDSFDARWSSVETWLFGILMRVARNHRRSLRRRAWAIPSTGDIVDIVPSPAAGPAELVARREAVALLDRLLDSLDEEKRAIIVLVDVEQMSVPQAAGVALTVGPASSAVAGVLKMTAAAVTVGAVVTAGVYVAPRYLTKHAPARPPATHIATHVAPVAPAPPPEIDIPAVAPAPRAH